MAFENLTSWFGRKLFAYLPPRLRKRFKIFSDFRDLCDSIGVKSVDSSKDQVLFVGAGNLEKWAHAFAAWEKAKGSKLLAFELYLKIEFLVVQQFEKMNHFTIKPPWVLGSRKMVCRTSPY